MMAAAHRNVMLVQHLADIVGMDDVVGEGDDGDAALQTFRSGDADAVDFAETGEQLFRQPPLMASQSCARIQSMAAFSPAAWVIGGVPASNRAGGGA